jgi:hypothetical protein
MFQPWLTPGGEYYFRPRRYTGGCGLQGKIEANKSEPNWAAVLRTKPSRYTAQ